MEESPKSRKTTDYSYTEGGIRVKKKVGSATTKYYLDGSRIVREDRNGTVLDYFFDESGEVIGFRMNGNDYYYGKNLQGDVVELYQNGSVIAVYEYDAWGKLLSIKNAAGTNITTGSTYQSHAGRMNPIRYRSYYYDDETGFYYLNSRYYDPKVGRFINADDPEYLGAEGEVTGFNLFAYCGNDPVKAYDPEGHFNWNTFGRGVSIALVGITAVATVITAGCAAPAVAAAIAVTSGVLCMGFGAAEITESVTDYNVFRDGLMNGNEQLYNAARTVVEMTASISATAVSTAAAVNRATDSLSQCFAEGTAVLTAIDCVPIEAIEPGDRIMAFDLETGETALKEVVQLFRGETEEWIHLSVDGEEIICTPNHPFYSPVKGWTAACELRAGDILVTVNGEYVILEKIQHELLERPETTYNFEVEDFHTYYVGSTEVLVHNSCNHASAWNTERRNYWKKTAKTVIPDKDYGSYVATNQNIERMTKGLAPKGWDGFSVQLHHWNGITQDFYNYSPVSRTMHLIIHTVM